MKKAACRKFRDREADQGLMPDKGWHRTFDDPIPLSDGGELRTLRDAGNYIAKLPKREQDAPARLAAIQALMLVVEHGGDTMLPTRRIQIPTVTNARSDCLRKGSIGARPRMLGRVKQALWRRSRKFGSLARRVRIAANGCHSNIRRSVMSRIELVEKSSSDRDDAVRVLRDEELQAVSGGYGEMSSGYVDDVQGGVTTYKKC
jgi:hypothetical protein